AVTWYGTASNHAQRRALVSLHQVAHGGDSFSLRYQRVDQELTRADQAARAACHVIELELPLGEPALILQLTIQVFELELLLPQLRDVTHDPGEEVACPDPEVADGQPCRKLASVSTARGDFAPATDDLAFAGLQGVFQITIVLHGDRVGHQAIHVLAEHLLFAVPKQTLGRFVERLHLTLGIDREDAIGSRIQHGITAQPCGVHFGSCAYQFADVAARTYEHATSDDVSLTHG